MKPYLYRIATDQDKDAASCVVKFFLWILSLIYALGVRLWAYFYDRKILTSQSLHRPVISVGNITWGGTGKTPLVEWLVKILREQNRNPVVLIRGYMPAGHGPSVALPSDEARQLKESVGERSVYVGRDRIRSARAALAHAQPDIFILDDGFQHRRVKRDLDIVVIDSVNPFGNGNVIPRGILREPVSHLSRASIIILSRTDLAPDKIEKISRQLRDLNATATLALAIHEPVHFVDLRSSEICELGSLRGNRAVSFCGIGRPEAFQETLAKIGVEVKKQFAFPDHHLYSWKDFQDMLEIVQQGEDNILLTTHKDSVKVRSFIERLPLSLRILDLRVRFKIIQGEHEVLRRISDLFRR